MNLSAEDPFMVTLAFICDADIRHGRPAHATVGLLIGTACHYAGLDAKAADDIAEVFFAKVLSAQSGGAS